MDENFELEERAALIADGCGVSQEKALVMAKQQREAEEKMKRAKNPKTWTQGRLVV